MTAAKPKTAGDLAATLAPTDHTPAAWSVKADGQVLHPNDPAPDPTTTHLELVDVTDHPWPTPPATDNDPQPAQD